MNKTLKQLILLLLVFTGGIALLLITHFFFLNLIDTLDKKTENLKAKIQVGEFLVEDIYKIRSDFYELTTTTTNLRGRELINKRILEKLKEIENSLQILEYGGVLKKTIKLNLVEHLSTTKLIKYKKIDDISMEVIDLTPKLEEFRQMLKTLNLMLSKQNFYRDDKDVKNFMAQNKKIKRFYKSTPSFFIRITENASRLLYEGAKELKELEKEIQKQKEYYIKIELIIIIAILTVSIFLGLLIAFQIHKKTKLLIRQEQFTRGTLDSQENIVVVSNGEKMIDANNALIEFFDNYNNFKDFEKKHKCICDFFEKVEGEELITEKMHKGFFWFEYIIKNPQDIHRVAMTKNGILNYFLITANKKDLDKDNSIIIVTLSNITKEIRTQKELKKLNENLEELVNEKTKELRILNETLEEKIRLEVEKNREKDKALIQQSRFAALGEMLGNIAHQWRQPLSAISSTATAMQLQMNLNLDTRKDLEKAFSSIVNYVGFLNQTIEDFRGFFRKDKQKEKFDILKKLDNSLSITKAVYKNNFIKVHLDLPKTSIKVLGFANELSQVFLNILNNAKDILLDRKIENKLVLIKIKDEEKNILIEIYDNAGGIEEKYLQKVFDPYFTTKHKSQGTGIGLYMSKYIIEKNMHGNLLVSNKKFTLEGKSYYGACFKIELPKI